MLYCSIKGAVNYAYDHALMHIDDLVCMYIQTTYTCVLHHSQCRHMI